MPSICRTASHSLMAYCQSGLISWFVVVEWLSPNGLRSHFVIGKSWVRISVGALASLTEVFRGFSQSFQRNSGVLPQIMWRPLPSISLRIHYAPIYRSTLSCHHVGWWACVQCRDVDMKTGQAAGPPRTWTFHQYHRCSLLYEIRKLD
jgi:hypothetical protein